MFDANTDRSGTLSYKMLEPGKFGSAPAISLGCADFDYDVAPEISGFVQARAGHKIYGYTSAPAELEENIIEYYHELHGLEIEENDILCMPGVLASLGALLQLYAARGARVILLEPEYPPFFKIARGFGLEPRILRLTNGALDYQELERELDETKLIIISNPHNPTGGVFDIAKICDFCKKANALLVSDEIWADFQLAGGKHVSAYDYGFPALLAPSKTFNMPGIPFSLVAWRDGAKLREMRDFCAKMHISAGGCFAAGAASLAYGKCAYWVEGLMGLLRANFRLVQAYLGDKINIIGGTHTCLLFLDCSRQFGSSDEARDFFLQNGVYLQSGNAFYCNGDCPGAWLRMNIGSPTSVIEKALKMMAGALSAAGK